MRTPKPYRRRTPDRPFQTLVAANAIAAFRDESYTLVAKVVDELMRDPEVARKVDFHARAMIKALVAKM